MLRQLVGSYKADRWKAQESFSRWHVGLCASFGSPECRERLPVSEVRHFHCIDPTGFPRPLRLGVGDLLCEIQPVAIGGWRPASAFWKRPPVQVIEGDRYEPVEDQSSTRVAIARGVACVEELGEERRAHMLDSAGAPIVKRPVRLHRTACVQDLSRFAERVVEVPLTRVAKDSRPSTDEPRTASGTPHVTPEEQWTDRVGDGAGRACEEISSRDVSIAVCTLCHGKLREELSPGRLDAWLPPVGTKVETMTEEFVSSWEPDARRCLHRLHVPLRVHSARGRSAAR